jgi:hypothetical protein
LCVKYEKNTASPQGDAATEAWDSRYSSTSTCIRIVTEPELAVMMAVPSSTALTLPFLLTVATESSELVHVVELAPGRLNFTLSPGSMVQIRLTVEDVPEFPEGAGFAELTEPLTVNTTSAK